MEVANDVAGIEMLNCAAPGASRVMAIGTLAMTQ
jgi:hypothetical protein